MGKFVSTAIAAMLFITMLETHAFAQWVPNGIPVGSTGQIQDQEAPFVCPDGHGGSFVAWGEQVLGSDTDFDGYLQHVLPDGRLDPRWPSRGLAFVVAPNNQIIYELTADGQGGAILFWVDLRSPNMANDLYAMRVDADGQLAPGWIPNGNLVCQGTTGHVPTSICADGLGGAYFAWNDVANGTELARVTHFSGDGTLGSGWPTGGRLVSSYSTLSGESALVPESDGCLVVWTDGRGATPLGYNMWALRFAASGDVYPGWDPAGTPLITLGTTVEVRHAVSDGAGGAFVAWDDNRVGVAPMNPFYYDIYAQHVFADGTRDVRWPKDGVAVCDAPDGQYDFDLAQDGSGGSVLMWEDDRGGFFQMFGQRLLADGSVAPGWVPNGTRVTTSPSTKFVPRIAADGLGGFYGVWQDYSGLLPIGGQHMRGDGSFDPSWTSAGLVLASSTSGGTGSPVLATDAQGGATLAYQRTDSAPWYRIYALRIQNDGPVPTLLSLADYDTGPGRVTLRWEASNAATIHATVERSPDGVAWEPLGAPRVEGTDLLVYDDLGVSAGRWSYRLAYADGAAQRYTEPVVVDVPAVAQLALGGFRPNPATSGSAIAFSLPDAGPSRLEVVDVRGRIMLSREVGAMGPGTHSLSLSEAGRLGAGVYWVRLVRPETTLTRKGVVAG